ncbi:sensor histidine kinase [Actinoplanes sp. NPDC051861]|uniref:sensor histidine kinase n=1 Tax=Actinoplanes sp. NPDC051861 TaxID=3155170 RepID=UPI003420FB0D
MHRAMSVAGPAVLALLLAAVRVAVAPVLPADRAPDALAYALVAAMAAALLLRTRLPAVTLAVVGALFFTYHVLRYPGGAPAVPVWIALYSVAVAPRRRAGLTVAALILIFDAHSRMTVAGIGPFDAALDGSTGVFVAALLLGEVVRGRRARLAMLAAEQERLAEERVVRERIRIARELHDVTAHTLAVVAVQAGVAADIQRDDPDGARAALETVRQAARDAMAELRAAVGVLRDGTREEGPAAPAPTLDRLPELAGDTGAVLISEGTPRRLSRAVEATAYRIVQEAVANAVRHAGASRIEVRVGWVPDGLSLDISDDGHGPQDGAEGGNGVNGMVERARGLGGWLRAGPRDEGGFQVRGWLPG